MGMHPNLLGYPGKWGCIPMYGGCPMGHPGMWALELGRPCQAFLVLCCSPATRANGLGHPNDWWNAFLLRYLSIGHQAKRVSAKHEIPGFYKKTVWPQWPLELVYRRVRHCKMTGRICLSFCNAELPGRPIPKAIGDQIVFHKILDHISLSPFLLEP